MNYDNSFKQEALELSDEIGVRKAAEQLGIPYYTLSGWRHQRRTKGEYAFVGSGNKRDPLPAKRIAGYRNSKLSSVKLSEQTRYSRKHSVFSHKVERSKGAPSL